MKLTKLLLVLTAASLAMMSSNLSVVAGTATSTFQVNVNVTNNCTITSTSVGFPNYDPVATHESTPDDSASGAVTITCTKGSIVHIGLGRGANASGSQRRMAGSGGNYLNYELYQNESRTKGWGNAEPDWLTPVAAPDKKPRTFTVYGRIAAGQDVPAGSYTDTVTATVNF